MTIRRNVISLGVPGSLLAGPGIFARRGIGMIHGEIVRPNGWAGGGGKVCPLDSRSRARNKSNDLCAHENPSHNAIATRPAKASEIRYAVMAGGSLFRVIVVFWLSQLKQMRGMIAFARVISGANPISLNERPRAGTFARAGKTERGSDGGARQGALRQALHGRLVRPADAVRIRKSSNEKARDRFPGAGSILVLAMMKICQ